MIKLDRPACPNPTALSKGNYKSSENKAALIKASQGKCMYCESRVTHTYYGDVEHIVPKSVKAELEFAWDNLGYVCAVCNGSKSNSYNEDLEILNPYIEDPSDHLVAAGSILYPLRGSQKGELTILDVNLNRLDLVQQRHDLLDRINRAIVACFNAQNQRLKSAALESLKAEATANKEYSLFVGSLLKSHDILN